MFDGGSNGLQQDSTALGLLTASQQRVEASLAEVAYVQRSLAAAVGEVHADLTRLSASLSSNLAATSSDALAAPSTGPVRQVSADSSQEQVGDGKTSINGSQGTSNMDDGFIAPTLPLSWPQTLELRKSVSTPLTLKKDLTVCGMGSWHGRRVVSKDKALQQSTRWTQRLRDPSCRANITFDVVGIIILAYELTIIPYLLAWGQRVEGGLEILATMSASYWTIDLLLSFYRGYYRHGELVHDARAIARRYSQTWFFPDLFLICMDWLSLPALASATADIAAKFKLIRFLKYGRFIRLLALFKVFRAVKVDRLITEILQSSNAADRLLAPIQTAMVFSAALWSNHLLTCAWFAIGTSAPSNTGARWIESSSLQLDELAFMDMSSSYQYIVALHWAVAQSTLGAMDVSPSNGVERIFGILCLLLGLVCGSMLISLLSASMMEFQMSQRDKKKQLRALHRYLRENAVGGSLAQRVQCQAAERLRRHDRLARADVHVLSSLSKELQTALHAEICIPHLVRHGFLHLVHAMDAKWFGHFLVGSVNIAFHRNGDDIFSAGAVAASAYYVVSGHIVYMQEPETSVVEEVETTDVEESAWLCESALWSKWIHVGSAKAVSACQLLELSADTCLEALTSHSVIGALAREYCQLFHRRIAAARPPHHEWPSDLQVPLTDYANMVFMMSRETRVLIAAEALNLLDANSRRARLRGSASAQKELAEEVSQGRAALLLDACGQVQRVLAIVVLRLTREDGYLFVHLCAWEGEHAVADCQLPAARILENEHVATSMQRLLMAKLPTLVGHVSLTSVRQQVKLQASKKYGIDTKYLRSECFARFSGYLDAPTCTATDDDRCQSMKSNQTTWTQGFFSHLSNMVPERFRRHPVFYFGDSAKGEFYTWLHEADFAHLSSPIGEADLKAWVSTLMPPVACSLADDEAISI